MGTPLVIKAETKTYQGKPCKRGHDGVRYVSNGECALCARIRGTSAKAREYGRLHYAAHREERLEYFRLYHAAHRDEQLEYARLYYAAHREEQLEYARLYYAAHREERSEYRRLYMQLRRLQRRAPERLKDVRI